MRGSKPGKNVQLQENEIRGLCLKSREIFLSQPILLELEAPLKICGECGAPYSAEGTLRALDVLQEMMGIGGGRVAWSSSAHSAIGAGAAIL